MDEQMQPGPGLDAAVAAALGRHHMLKGYGVPPELPDARLIEGCARIPKYSTDIAAAWLVVERLKAKGYDIEIGYDSVDCSWVASFMKGEKWGIVTVETAPHAICLAALEALEPS